MDRLDKLYEIADDYEVAVLDELAHRARLVWTCRRHDVPWTNQVGEPCEQCGKREDEHTCA